LWESHEGAGTILVDNACLGGGLDSLSQDHCQTLCDINDDIDRRIMFNSRMTSRLIRITRLAAATGAATPATLVAGSVGVA
jgi:hypothetical protein